MSAPSASQSDARPSLRSVIAALGLLGLSGVMAVSGNLLIQARYPDRPFASDLLFDLLPYWTWMRPVTDVIFIIGVVALGVYAFKEHLAEIPSIVAQFALLEGTRALIMVLTPLALPFEKHALPTVLGLRNYGEFPSGHAATVLLFYLLISRADMPRTKTVLGWLVVAECATLILSHAHYSIDVVGGLFLAYFINHAWTCGTVFDPVKRLIGIA